MTQEDSRKLLGKWLPCPVCHKEMLLMSLRLTIEP
jgi:hypothetical protein